MSEHMPDGASANLAIDESRVVEKEPWKETGSDIDKYEHLSDGELVELLQARVQTLEYRLESAEDRDKDLSLVPSGLLLAVAVVLLILVFVLAMTPYYVRVGDGSREVPGILTFVAAFGIVIFGYLSYRAFVNLLAMIELRKSSKYEVNDGRRVLNRAESLIKEVEASEVASTETEGLG